MLKQAITLAFFVASFSTIGSPAYADALSDGIDAYTKGDVGKAIKKWNKSKKPEAIWRIAGLAEEGRLENCDKIECAASWYYKAAMAGHIPAITNLAILNFNNGYKDEGLYQFKLAARFNNQLARDLLTQMGEDVPNPDLYNQLLQQEQQQRIAAQVAAQQEQAAAAQILGYLIGCSFGNACAQSSVSPFQPQAPGFGMRSYRLQSEWFASTADRMCRYENGTVINVGSRSCAASITGQ